MNHVLEMIINRESPYNSEKVIKMCLEVNHGTTILIGSFGNICFKDSDTDHLVVGRDPWITSDQSGLSKDIIKKIYVSSVLEKFSLPQNCSVFQ